MRATQWFSCLVMFCLIAMLFPACGIVPEQPPATITMDPTQTYSFSGWGTSLAWWAEAVGQWDASKRSTLEDALFNPNTGLGLNVIRYNIGANTPDNQCKGAFRALGSINSFEPSSGVWNWSRDQSQVQVLQDAKIKGADIFEGFANSAPAWMLSNHCTQGNGLFGNLLPGAEQDYANYLATIIQQFHDNRDLGNITFQTIEPFNEPDLPWPGQSPYQEGMHVSTPQQETVIQDLYAALQQKGALSYTSISANDSNSINSAVSDYDHYNSATKGDISQLNTHGYNGNQRSNLYQIGQESGKRIWMSEYTTTGADNLGPKCVDPKKVSAKMVGALQLSCQISRDINLMHPSAWVYWQAVENSAFGLLRASLDPSGKQDFTYNEQYYALWQYSHFIRPGYQILANNDPDNTVVAYDSASHSLVIVTTNDDPSISRTVNYNLSKFSGASLSVTPYVTNDSVSAQKQSPFAITNKQFTATVPPGSIVTYVISNAAIASPATTVPMPQTETSCPTFGAARAAVIRPLALGTDQNIVYMETDNNSTSARATLYRYNMKTQRTIQLTHIETAAGVGALAEVSSDGQWVVFTSEINGLAAIQMIRMDGQGLQTLYCLPSPDPSFTDMFSQLHLSPDQKQLIFSDVPQETVTLLDMTNGTLQTLLQPQQDGTFYEPVMWLTNTQLYLWRYPIAQSALFLLNTQNGSNQLESALADVANLPLLVTFDISPDRTQLFTGTCQLCGQGVFIGPSTISVQSATGTTQRVIRTTTGAIVNLVAASNNILLFSIRSYSQSPDQPADTRQDGIWEIHTDGSGLKRLIAQAGLSAGTYGLAIGDHQDISPDGKIYLLTSGSSLLFAPLDGGTAPTQFASTNNGGFLTAVGWTRM